MRTHKLVVAHRGVRTNGHANTIDAFERAIQLGADMLELDVRRTGDGALVVHHDETIGDQRLGALEVAEAQRAALALGYAIPTLADVIRLASGRVQLDVELKENGCEKEVLALLFEHRSSIPDFVITSFDARTLACVAALNPGVRTGFLMEHGDAMIDRFRESGAAFLAPHYQLLDERTLEQAERSGVPLLPWTVNEASIARRLFRHASVWGVITDDTANGLRIRNSL